MNKVFQIYYDEQTRGLLDSLAYPVFNKSCTDYFENDVILALYDLYEGDYTGVLSPRFKEKTGKDLKWVFKQLKDHDIYILCGYDDARCEQFWNKTFWGSVVLKDKINAAGILPFTISHYTWVNAYCNFILCRPEIMRDYIDTVLKPVKDFLQTTTDVGALKAISTPVKHRSGFTSIIPYFLEGLWGCYIGNSQHTHKTLIKPKPVFL